MFDTANLKRIFAVARIEMLQLLRERTTFSLIVIVPALQLILFGYAVNLDPKEITIAIAGTKPGLYDRITEIAEKTTYFQAPTELLPQGQAAEQVRSGKALIGIELPEEANFDDFDKDTKPLTLYIDASDSIAVAAAAAALENGYMRRLASMQETPITAEVRWLFNPERRTSWTIVPGLIGAVVMISMLMLGALSLVSERERGTWETLLTTPVRGIEALLGKLAPCALLSLVQAGIVMVAASVLFDVPMTGAFGLLFIVIPLFATAHLMLGFAFSAVAKTQLQAVQGAVAFYLPSMLLSGFMFPYQGMPAWAQGFAEIIPLTHFVRISRGLLLRGQSLSEMWPDLLAIVLFLLGAMTLALRAYRKNLD